MQSGSTDYSLAEILSSSDILNLIGAFIDVNDKHRLVAVSQIVKEITALKTWPIVNGEGNIIGTVTFL